MDLLNRLIGLCAIRIETTSSKRAKGGDEEAEKAAKTKSQLEFETGIDEKPVITDVKYIKKRHFRPCKTHFPHGQKPI